MCALALTGWSCGGATSTSPTSTTVPSSTSPSAKLLGTWSLTFTISALAGAQTNVYHFTVIQQVSGVDAAMDLTINGHFGAFGYYDNSAGNFVIRDSGNVGNPQDLTFTFSFTGTDSVSGCLYAFAKGSSNLGQCHAMTGVRTAG
ncbi:MAG: hypothetical protein HY048_02705 [Acidobacteria bacterium]|nr:hypothetical protein [Acidobacteriota bacterium]